MKLADSTAANQRSINGDTGQSIVLVTSEGLMSKPNAPQPLGIVRSVSFLYIVHMFGDVPTANGRKILGETAFSLAQDVIACNINALTKEMRFV